MANKTSPAVESLENEQSIGAPGRDELREGLQETFPASDPVSATTTGIPSRSTPPSTQRARGSDAPRVDEALESILEHRNDPYAEPREQIAAVRDEVESLRYRAADDLRGKIRANPWQAVALGATIGFLFGLTR
jgi:ElaB/YqjD/DUF883 family membrane-anchored ribosome-binding protein